MLDRVRGSADVPLTAEGRKQIKTLAPKLPAFRYVITSNLKRAKETANLLEGAISVDP